VKLARPTVLDGRSAMVGHRRISAESIDSELAVDSTAA
jgi:hypothetical protein